MKSKKKNRTSSRKKTFKRKSFKKKTVKRKSFRNKTVKRKRFKKVMKGGVTEFIVKTIPEEKEAANFIPNNVHKKVFADLQLTETTTIYDNAFQDYKNLKSIKFPNTLKSIGKLAFNNCSSLLSVDLSSTKLTTIEESAFQGCTSLESVILPKNITSIEKLAFQGCSSLKKIDLSKHIKLTTIPESAFQGCTSLESFILPKNITSIEKLAFGSCTSLTKILSYSKLIEFKHLACYRCFKLCKNLLFPEKIFYIDLSKTSININKKIILVGEVHSPPFDSVHYNNQEIPSFILELLDRLKVDNKKLDIFLETPYEWKLKNPPNPSNGGGKIQKYNLRGGQNNTLDKIINFFVNCIKEECKIEGKTYQNCRLHYMDIRRFLTIDNDIEKVFGVQNDNNIYNLYYHFINKYDIKNKNEFLDKINQIFINKNITDKNILKLEDLDISSNKPEFQLDKLLSVANYRIFETIQNLITILNKRETRKDYVSNIITTNKIIHFCLYFEYTNRLTIINFNSRVMDIYNLIRMFQIFKDDRHPNSEYIITYHGNLHTYTYYYFLLFIQLPEKKQQELINSNEIIKIETLTTDDMRVTLTKQKFVKIEVVIRNQGEVPFETYGHLIDDFVKDFPIKVSGSVEIEDDNDKLNV